MYICRICALSSNASVERNSFDHNIVFNISDGTRYFLTYVFLISQIVAHISYQDFVLIINVQLLIVFVCLYITPSHYHHCANLPEDIEHRMPVRYILSSVWLRLSIFCSVIPYTIYGTVCFQFTHLSWDDWENIHFVLLSSSNMKYELLSIV